MKDVDAPMPLADGGTVLREAARISNHRHFVVAGSLSAIGAVIEAPRDMAMYEQNGSAVPNDVRWVRAGLKAGIVQRDVVHARIAGSSASADEAARARSALIRCVDEGEPPVLKSRP